MVSLLKRSHDVRSFSFVTQVFGYRFSKLKSNKNLSRQFMLLSAFRGYFKSSIFELDISKSSRTVY